MTPSNCAIVIMVGFLLSSLGLVVFCTVAMMSVRKWQMNFQDQMENRVRILESKISKKDG